MSRSARGERAGQGVVGRAVTERAAWAVLVAAILGFLLSAAVHAAAATPAPAGFPPPPALAERKFPVPAIPWAPRTYDCGRALTAPAIDGVLDDPAWQTAPWTEAFGDIEGDARPAPRFRTRAKMAWDDSCFYVSAEMEEPDIWATYDRRDMVIYHENDFEVFIDPDGDTHEYYELEINALNTVWDLLLLRPYRDGGPAVNAWDIAGLRTAVHLDGTLNDPADRDRGWSVEIAFPWAVLAECAHRAAPPAPGDEWRVNFSRVEWWINPRPGGYEKRKDPLTGRSLPENNWTWSPQGLIAMHYPEMWGIVRFVQLPEPAAASGATPAPATREAPAPPALAAPVPALWAAPDHDPDAAARWRLRLAYYAEKELFERERRFSADPRELPGFPAGPDEVGDGLRANRRMDLRVTQSGFEATLPSADGKGTLHVRDDGRTGRSEP